jgi:hypothetical protein
LSNLRVKKFDKIVIINSSEGAVKNWRLVAFVIPKKQSSQMQWAKVRNPSQFHGAFDECSVEILESQNSLV